MNHELIAEYLKQIDLAENEHSPWRRSDYADGLVDILRDIFTDDELIELAQAKAEGRLVVLPCKVGDTVYHRSGQHTIDDIQLFYPRQNGHVPEERIGKLQIRLGSLNYAGLQTFATYADEIGKTVFLSREEAEKALGGAEDGK
jgi:hypothetical protein